MKTFSIGCLVMFACFVSRISATEAEAPGSVVTFTGTTHADDLLKRDTLKFIAVYVRARGCDKIDHVDSTVVFYEARKKKKKKDHVWGREGWMVTACKKGYPFYVVFTEDGIGGTFLSIEEVELK